MSFLATQHTKILVQGLTGKEGQRIAGWLHAAGAPFDTQIVAGVTPGKGGQHILDIPVYNTVAEALANHPQINTSSICVPPARVYAAALEAIEARIPLIHIFAEGVPTLDTARILEKARAQEVRILGPSALGVASPGQSVIGSVGGGNFSQFLLPGQQGPQVAVLSKSGGMANTIASMLTAAGIAQSTIVGIGGDRLVGTTFADLVELTANDPETHAVVLIGEIGGSYEEDFAAQLIEQGYTKPVVAFVSGLFAQTLPQGVAFGHAGAIVSKTVGTRAGKIAALSQAGAHVVESPSDICPLLYTLLVGEGA